MGDFSVAIEHMDGTVLLRPSGELDLRTALELERVLRRVVGEHWAVVVDLSDLTFADCAGLRPIRWALAQPYLVSVRSTETHPRVRRVLELTGLQRSGGSRPTTVSQDGALLGPAN